MDKKEYFNTSHIDVHVCVLIVIDISVELVEILWRLVHVLPFYVDLCVPCLLILSFLRLTANFYRIRISIQCASNLVFYFTYRCLYCC